jgi:hypothetical protein
LCRTGKAGCSNSTATTANPFETNVIRQLQLGQWHAQQSGVSAQIIMIREFRWKRALRRGMEYAVAIGTALLCSYWILQGR